MHIFFQSPLFWNIVPLTHYDCFQFLLAISQNPFFSSVQSILCFVLHFEEIKKARNTKLKFIDVYISWITEITFANWICLFLYLCTKAFHFVLYRMFCRSQRTVWKDVPHIYEISGFPSSLLMQMSFTVGANCFTELLQIKSRCLSLCGWMEPAYGKGDSCLEATNNGI